MNFDIGIFRINFVSVNQNLTDMKLGKIFLILSIPVLFSLSLFGQTSPEITAYLYKVSSMSDPNKRDLPDNPDRPDYGRRSPGLQCLCVIDPTDGVSIDGCDRSDVTSYYIYDEEDELLLETPDETLFIETLFSLSGVYRISLETDDWIYSGWIEI